MSYMTPLTLAGEHLLRRRLQQQLDDDQDQGSSVLSSNADDDDVIATASFPLSGGNNGYTSSQEAFLRTAPRITAALSVLGTAWIVWEVLRCSPNKRSHVYHRLVAAMAFYCLWNSLAYFVSGWATTTSADAADDASSPACRTQGYLIQLSVGPAVYYSMLFLYYALVICFSCSERRLRRHWEPAFHFVPLVVSVVTATAGLPLGLYHPSLADSDGVDDDPQNSSCSSPWCWIAPADPDDDAESFQRVAAFQWGFYLGPAWLSYGCTMVALVAVFRGVQAQEGRMKKYSTAAAAAGTVRMVPAKTSTTLSDSAVTASSKEGAVPSSARRCRPHHHRRRPRLPLGEDDESTSRNEEDTSRSCHPPEEDGDGPGGHPPLPRSASSSRDASLHQDVTATSMPSSLTDPSGENGVVADDDAPTVRHRLQGRFLSLLRYERIREYWEHRPRTRQVVVQAMCYVGAFFWSNIFLTVNQLIVWHRGPGHHGYRPPYSLIALQVVSQPLQGFLIFCAYRRPTYMRLRRTGLSRWRSLATSLEWSPAARAVQTPAGRGAGASALTSEKREELRSRRKQQLTEERRMERERMQLERHHQEQGRRRRHRRKVQRHMSEPIELSASTGVPRREGRKAVWRTQRPSFLRLLGVARAERIAKGNDDGGFLSAILRDGERGGLATVEERLQRSQSAPFPLALNLDYDDAIRDGGPRRHPKDGSDGAPGRDFCEKGHDSCSTANTRRTSTLTKDGSSRRLDLMQMEDSMGLSDFLEDLDKGTDDDDCEHDDEGSFSLEEIVSGSAEADDGDDEDDSDDGDTQSDGGDEKKDSESQHDGGRRRRGFGFFGSRESREDFEAMQQHSDRYMDLVCMDIIPEADGAIEEKWRAIEVRSGRYKKTKNERQKLNMSLPVLSERELSVYPPLSMPPQFTKDGTQPTSNKTEKSTVASKPRHGWSKLNANPLFKISGRWKTDPPTRTVQGPQEAHSPSPSSEAPIDTRGVPRTSSGGYFHGTMEKDSKESAFWEKLQLEKKRKDILKAIGLRRLSDDNLDENGKETLPPNNGADPRDVEGRTDDPTDSKEEAARKSLEDARPNLQRPIRFGNWNRLRMDDSEDFDVEAAKLDGQLPSEEGIEGDRRNNGNGSSRWPSLGLDRARREIMNSWGLDYIPETSEHSEAAALGGGSDHDAPPVYPLKRSSSGESSLRDDLEGGEGSNEMTLRSSGSSKHTVKQSNKHRPSEERGHRRSSSSADDRRRSSFSGLSSDEVSLVSDTLLSDDEGFSSSDDSLDHGDGGTRRGSGSSAGTKEGKAGEKRLRDSLSELQRLSERSMEDMGESSNSFHIDTGDLLLDSSKITDQA